MTKIEYLKNKYYKKWYNNYPQDLKNLGGNLDIDTWWRKNLYFAHQSYQHAAIDQEFREFLKEWKTPSLID